MKSQFRARTKYRKSLYFQVNLFRIIQKKSQDYLNSVKKQISPTFLCAQYAPNSIQLQKDTANQVLLVTSPCPRPRTVVRRPLAIISDPVTGSQPITSLALRLKRHKEPVETSSPELYFLQRRKHRAQWASNTLLTTANADTSLAAVGVIIFLLCLSFPFLVAVGNSPFPTLTHIHKHSGAVPYILFPQSAIHLPIGFTLKGPCL